MNKPKPPKQLKPYAAFSSHNGPSEGAILVLAFNARHAKKLAFGYCLNGTNQGIRLIKDNDIFALANQEMLTSNKPHVIEDPIHCIACNQWGHELTIDDLCCYCDEFPGDELINKHKDYKTNDFNR